MVLTPIIEAFVLCCITVVVPVLAMLYFSPTLRARAFFLGPIGIALFTFMSAVSAALMYSYVPFGPEKIITVATISTVVTYLMLRKMVESIKMPNVGNHNFPVFLIILGLAGLAITDIFFILSQQGFHSDSTTYFRTPLQSDNERHLILVNAIIRGDGSPFFPGAEHRYQILWHHYAALIVQLLSNPTIPTYYHLVSGVILFTSYVLFITLFWFAYLIRPKLFRSYAWIIIIFTLVAMHADVFNFLLSWLIDGSPGIEADYSVSKPIYRNFSPKLAGLTAPQHAFFLIALTLYLGLKQTTKRSLPEAPQVYVLIPVMIIISPILAALFLPFSMLIDSFQLARQKGWGTAFRYIIKAVVLLFLGALAFWLILRFPPTDLLFRDGFRSSLAPEWTYLKFFLGILAVPAAFVAACGTLGVTLLVVTLWLLFTKRFSILRNRYLLIALLLIYVANSVVENDEIRRHTAILVFIIALVVILQFLHFSRHIHKSAFLKYFIASSAAITILLHGYFVFSYTGKTSVISSDIPWKDYLCMNKIIQERYPNTPTWASTDDNLRFPLVMEIAPSFSSWLDIDVHSRSPRIKTMHKIAEHGIDPEIFLRELGYRLIVWGPIEKSTKFLPIPPYLVSSNRKVAHCGSVELYDLRLQP